MVANHLALARTSPNVVNTAQGGFFGTQTDLALAIVRAVDAWRLAVTTPGATSQQRRLVINLSLGWDPSPSYGGSYPGNSVAALPPPARAVHAAITHAVCQGALVIAAAGNQSGGSAPTMGPMFPAGWESKPAPGVAACQAFEGPFFVSQVAGLQVFGASPGYQPLVHAVAGVDGADAPLSSTRVGGRPRLAAYAYHVVTSDGLSHSDILTGSSMAAASVSGIAATVWGYRPSLTAAQVMALVYSSGLSLDPSPAGAVKADFCLSGACGTTAIRRVSQCRAVALACPTGAERCPATPPSCLGTTAPYAGEGPTWLESTWPAALENVPHSSGALREDAACTSAQTCAPADSKIENKYAMPWVKPQPGWTGCDVCALSDGTLYLGLDPAFPTFQSVTLTVQTTTGSATYELTSSINALPSSANYELSGLPATQDVIGATLSFGASGFSTSEQIITF